MTTNTEKMLQMTIVIFIGAATIYLVQSFLIYLYPFIIAVIIAFFLQPFIRFTKKHLHMNHNIATIFVMMTICSCFIVFLYIFTEKLITGLLTLSKNIPHNIDTLKILFIQIGQTFYEKVIHVFPFIEKGVMSIELEPLFEKGSTIIIQFLTNILSSTSLALASISHFFIIIIFIVLAVYMLSKDYELVISMVLKLIPAKIIQHFSPVLDYAKQSFIGLIRAQIVITCISSTIIFISLLFINIEQLFIITIIIFFVDFIPYIGIGVIFIPWVLLSFVKGQFVLTIELAVIYMIVLVVRQMIEPKLLAKEMGIHPFIALSVLFIGYQTMGLLGVLLTPIMLILISSLHKAQLFKALYDYVYK